MLRKFMVLMLRKIYRFISLNIEKTLVTSVFVILAVLFAAQLGLLSDRLSPFLSDVEVFEGQYISDVDNIIKEGTIALMLVDLESERDAKVLVNGKLAAAFTQKTVEVNVKNNSVIEIDGSKITSPIRVRITSKSGNIIDDIDGKEVETNSNIKVIARVRVK